MTSPVEFLLGRLQDDIVSHGEIVQCITASNTDVAVDLWEHLSALLTTLLSSSAVEIGSAILASPDYVEFIAWNGSIPERVERAIQAARLAGEEDKEFAYWICLRSHVDHYE